MTFIRQDGANFKTPVLAHPPARKNAKGQHCTLMLPCCNGDPETTVLAHLRMFGAAGISQKPDDWFAVFACSACHDAIDRRGGETSGLWGDDDIIRALHRTLKIQFSDGVFGPGNGRRPR